MDKERNDQDIKKTEPPIPEGSALSVSDNNIAQDPGKINVNWRVHLTSQELKSIFDEHVKEPTVHFGFLVEQGVNFIVAKAGEGKSYLCMSAAIQIAKENPDMLVFYIDLDNPDWVAKVRGIPEILAEGSLDNMKYIVRNSSILERVKAVFESAGVYKQFKQEYEKNKMVAWIHAIRATTKEEKKVMIVFDSLQRFIDYNDYGQVSAAFNEMEKLKDKGYTFLIIHHKNKAGEQKGLQLLNDNADQFIYIKDVKKNNDNEIIEQTLELDKARAGNKNIVNIKYIDLLTFTTMNDDIDYSKDEKLVLGFAISVLKKELQLKQNELIARIMERVAVGEKKTRRILNKFENRLFNVEKGEKRSKLYSLKIDSDILRFFEEGKYTGTKKALLDTVDAMIVAGEELTMPIEFEIGGKRVVYNSLNAIRNNILGMKHDEAEEVLQILSERYHEG